MKNVDKNCGLMGKISISICLFLFIYFFRPPKIMLARLVKAHLPAPNCHMQHCH